MKTIQMTRPESLSASYAFCRSVCRRAGSNFAPSFRLLSPAKRPAMHALYAFTRFTDDLCDNQQSTSERREAIAAWFACCDRARLGDFAQDLAAKNHALATGLAILPALADAAARFHIPWESLEAVIEGQEMDLTRHRYETFADLEQYCQRVASAVGVACIHIWGFGDRAVMEPARKCGIAFQLTNILRDLKEDAAAGRVYLPLEDLRAHDYTVDDLVRGIAGDRFLRLMDFEIRRARQLYEEGSQVARYLEPDGRRAFGVMCDIYGRLLDEIQRQPAAVLQRRIRLGRWQKLRIALGWLLRPNARCQA